MQREKLGSTAVGNGVAIPHGKLPKLGRLFGLFARLERPVDFEALDGQPVDLVFLLLAPEAAGADHLKALARVARLLRDPEIARKLARIARRRRALRRAGDAAGEQRGVSARVNHFELNAPRQCTLTGSSSWLQALAIAASRVSVSMIGVPSAACSANSMMPGAICGACGNCLATSSERIGLT